MSELARSEVSQSKQAFLLRDVALAEDLVRQDAENQRAQQGDLRAGRSRSAPIRTCASGRLTMMLVAVALERIGDNAVDVGEQIAFVVSGLFREFSDASRRDV
jgi:phosphate transport system protein